MKFDIEKGVKENQIVIQEIYGGNNSLQVMENRSDVNENLFFVDNIDVEYCEDDLQLGFSVGSCTATPLIIMRNKDYIGKNILMCEKEVQEYQIGVLKEKNGVKIISVIENKSDIYTDTFFIKKIVKEKNDFNTCEIIPVKIMDKEII